MRIAISTGSALAVVALALSVVNSLRAGTPMACHPILPRPPVWSPPTGYPRSDCTPSQIAAIWKDCYSEHDEEACRDDRFVYAACAVCLVTKEDAPSLGPLIERSHRISVNIGGCLALETGDTTAAGCGGAWGAYEDCYWSACLDRCWGLDARGIDGGNLALAASCNVEANADGGVCAPYRTAALAACTRQGREYEVCQTGPSLDEYARTVAAIFCAAPVDSGTHE